MNALTRLALARVRFVRSLVAWGVAVLLLGDVWHLPHLLLVRHVVCGEHGELVHDHDRTAARAPSGGATPEESRVSSGESAVHAHEHCSALATAARTPALGDTPVCSVALLAAAPDVYLVYSGAEARLPTGVLTYAPKQGPPARA